MTSRQQRAFMIAASSVAFLACAGIVSHFALSEPALIPAAAELARIPHITLADTKAIDAPSAPKAPPNQALPGQTVSLKAPTADFSGKAGDDLKSVPRFRLKPEEFAFDILPFDAPLAEFPFLLADQRLRDFDLTRDMDMDSRMSPSEADILSRMQGDVHGGPPGVLPTPPGPSEPPGTPEIPPEESNSGL